jgi:hypothetical protein
MVEVCVREEKGLVNGLDAREKNWQWENG